MAQNAPFSRSDLGQGQPVQNHYGMPGIAAGQPSAPKQALPQGMQGIDPKVLAMVQQALKDPNAGDILSKLQAAASQAPQGTGLPGLSGEQEEPVDPLELPVFRVRPDEMGIGALGGILSAVGLGWLCKDRKDAAGNFIKGSNRLNGIVEWIDKRPGIHSVSKGLDNKLANKRSEWWDEVLLHNARTMDETAAMKLTEQKHIKGLLALAKEQGLDEATLKKLSLIDNTDDFIDAARTEIMQLDNKAKLKLLGRLQQGELTPALVQKLAGQKSTEAFTNAVKQEINTLEAIKTLSKPEQAKLNALKHLQREKGFARETIQRLAKAKHAQGFKGVVEAEINTLKSLGKDLSKADLAKFKALRGLDKEKGTILAGLKEGMIGTKDYLFPLQKQKFKRFHNLYKRGVGAIGRAIASGTDYVYRVFNGDAMTSMMGGGSGGGFFSKYAGPVLAGIFFFGMPLAEARRAKEGEKKAAFFHNLLGEQLGMIIGMDASRRILRGSQWVHRLLGSKALKLPMMFFKRFTWAGILAEMAAMFLLSIPFQKAGEALAHTVFGKTTKEKVEDGELLPRKVVKELPPGKLEQSALPYDAMFNQQDTAAQPISSGQPQTNSGLRPSPDEIRINPMRTESNTLAEQVKNMPWDLDTTLNPFGQQHAG